MFLQNALYTTKISYRSSDLMSGLKKLGLDITRTKTTRQTEAATTKKPYCLAVMEYELLGKTTFRICSKLLDNNTETIVVVILKKYNSYLESRLFDAGVGDVVASKQTNSHILIKRIKAHLKKTNPKNIDSSIRLRNTIINLQKRQVWCNGKIKQLKGIVSDLLKYFLENPDRIITRDELLNSPIWSDSICSMPNEGGKTFDVNISKLRKIIEPDPSKPQIITSVRGMGWKLNPNVLP